MWIRLRQIAVVTSDLLETALDIQTVLGVEACHTDPGVSVFGLKNTLWPIGESVLGVCDTNNYKHRWRSLHRAPGRRYRLYGH